MLVLFNAKNDFKNLEDTEGCRKAAEGWNPQHLPITWGGGNQILHFKRFQESMSEVLSLTYGLSMSQ